MWWYLIFYWYTFVDSCKQGIKAFKEHWNLCMYFNEEAGEHYRLYESGEVYFWDNQDKKGE
jgi:hypothetical protein